MGPLASPFSASTALQDLFKFGSWQQSNAFLFSAIPCHHLGPFVVFKTTSSQASQLELTFHARLYNLPQHMGTPSKAYICLALVIYVCNFPH